MIEYLHDPDATSAAVDADGFLHTGDLGSMDARGYLTITGRIKDLIIRGGENVSPVEIESCLAAHPAVADVAVFGVPDEHWGETIPAAVRIHGSASADLRATLEAYTKEHLARFKMPAHWYVVDQFPVTPTGKVQRFKLRELVGTPQLPPL